MYWLNNFDFLTMRLEKKYLLLFLFCLILFSGATFALAKYFSQTKNESQENPLDISETEHQNASILLTEPTRPEAPPMPESTKINESKEKTLAQNNSAEGEAKKNPTEAKPPKEVAQPSGDTLKITRKPVSWGFEKASQRKIDTIIIHSSYDALGKYPYDVEGVLAEYKEYGVSPHYVIDRDGIIYQLVAEENIAYHAGQSQMPDGRSSVNNFSIGIEVLTTKTEKPTARQYDALNDLLPHLKKKYPITFVLGHSQIAPDRKDDPWNFEWSKIE